MPVCSSIIAMNCNGLQEWDRHIYYPVDTSTTVFSYSRAMQYQTILHSVGVIAWAPGYPVPSSNHNVL